MIKKRMSYAQIIALGFFIVIALGTCLLLLPISYRGPRPGVLAALFTAVSSTCVTGLVVVDTATAWTGFGQAVILVMIQTGGLGFMTFATLFFYLLRRKMSIRERSVMAESINSQQIGRVRALTVTICRGTALFEGLGALLLATRFVPEFGWEKGVWYSLFHSVSAFCNAGFDLMGVKAPFSSLTDYAADPVVNLTIMSLITIGGLGFLVWDDLLRKKFNWKRYTLQTKIVLTFALALTLGGAVLFFLMERGRINAGMPLGEQILVSLFSAVTPRTAGFNTVDTASLSTASKLLTILLMFVGGGSGSTAGGIKMTTLAVLLLTLASGIRKHRCTYAFGRKIPDDAVRKAVLVAGTNLMLALTGAILIGMVQDVAIDDLLLEVFSAIGTVGMSTGVTRELVPFSQCIVILLMFCGRVGSVSFATALLEKKAAPAITYPEEQITIG